MKTSWTIILALFILNNYSYSQSKSDFKNELFESIKNYNKEYCKELILSGIDVNSTDENGASALMWAAYKGELDIVKLLILKGADVKKKGVIYLNTKKTTYYGNLLGIAAGECNLELVQFLIENCGIPVDDIEINPETKNEEGWTALQWASSKGCLVIAEYLLSKKANINANQSSDKYTPLICALILKDTLMAKYLILNGAEINFKNSEGENAICSAARKGLYNIVKLLIIKGADINSSSYGGWSILHYAARDGETEIIKLLNNKGADMNIKTDSLFTPLHLAVINNFLEISKYLISKGAQVDAVDIKLMTPLHYAVHCNNENIFKLLINNNVNINGQNILGQTPLHIAVLDTNIYLARLLYWYGADMRIKDKNNNDVIELAEKRKLNSILQFLKNSKQDTEIEIAIKESDTLLKSKQFEYCIKYCSGLLNNPKKIKLKLSQIQRDEIKKKYEDEDVYVMGYVSDYFINYFKYSLLRNRAKSYFSIRKFDNAEDDFNKLLYHNDAFDGDANNYDHAEDYDYLSIIFALKKDTKKAAFYNNKAIAKNPEKPNRLAVKGHIYLLAGNLEKAKEYYEYALKYTESYSDFKSEILETFDLFIENNNNDSLFQELKDWILEIRLKNIGESSAKIKYKQSKDWSSELYNEYKQIKILYKNNKYSRVIKKCKEILKTQSDIKFPFMLLAGIYFEKHNYDESKYFNDKLLELDPENTEGLKRKIKLLKIKFQYADCAPLYEQLIKEKPYDKDLLLSATKNSLRLGDLNKS